MEKINLQHLDHDTLIAVVEAADWRELHRLDLTNLDLSGVNLEQNELSSFDFSGSNLTGANFYVSLLAGANFTNANLTGANLTYCVMEDVILTGANLTDADLTGSSFRSPWADELRRFEGDEQALLQQLREAAERNTFLGVGDGRHVWATEGAMEKIGWEWVYKDGICMLPPRQIKGIMNGGAGQFAWLLQEWAKDGGYAIFGESIMATEAAIDRAIEGGARMAQDAYVGMDDYEIACDFFSRYGGNAIEVQEKIKWELVGYFVPKAVIEEAINNTQVALA